MSYRMEPVDGLNRRMYLVWVREDGRMQPKLCYDSISGYLHARAVQIVEFSAQDVAELNRRVHERHQRDVGWTPNAVEIAQEMFPAPRGL